MKKYLSLILVLTTVFLAGCNVYGDKFAVDTESENQSSGDAYSEVLTEYGSTPIDHNGVDVPLPTFSYLYEYEKFISETELPEDFVYYEDIKELGIFTGLVILSTVRKDGYSNYRYVLFPSEKYNDFMKNSFGFEIAKDPWSNEFDSAFPLLMDTDVDTSDLMALDSAKNGTYMLEGLKYKYRGGRLESIRWKSGDWYYSLEFEKNFHESFDPNDDANIAKAFNAETAIEFISSFAPPEKAE